jgi:hypothetical protein
MCKYPLRRTALRRRAVVTASRRSDPPRRVRRGHRRRRVPRRGHSHRCHSQYRPGPARGLSRFSHSTRSRSSQRGSRPRHSHTRASRSTWCRTGSSWTTSGGRSGQPSFASPLTRTASRANAYRASTASCSVALVFPLGKCWLLSIRRLLAVVSRYDHPGPGHRLDQKQREDIQLYVDYLSQPAALVPLTPALTRPGRRRTVRLVSDASFTALCGSDTHPSCRQAGPGFRFSNPLASLQTYQRLA